MNVNDLASVCVKEVYRQNIMFLNIRLLYSSEPNNCTVNVQALVTLQCAYFIFQPLYGLLRGGFDQRGCAIYIQTG